MSCKDIITYLVIIKEQATTTLLIVIFIAIVLMINGLLWASYAQNSDPRFKHKPNRERDEVI